MEAAIERRIGKLREILAQEEIDTFVVLSGENRRYLSGFTGEDGQFDESSGALVITEGEQILATDSRYELQAKDEAPLYEIVCYKEGLIKELPGMVHRLGTRRLGFESVRMSYSQYKSLAEELDRSSADIELLGTENIVENLRVIKEESEIDSTRQALAIAESVFDSFRTEIREGMTEKEAAWAMERGMREAGADALSFPVICASGPNSALPHAIPGDRTFRKGEPVLFDWGARLNGYCSDISRTLVIGEPDDTFEKLYGIVHNAQRKAIDAIKAGMSTVAADGLARDYIHEMGFEGRFGHGLGHGTGLAIHEQPRLSPYKETTLEAGMIVTVEPGIYLPDWGGIRLENMVVIREDGVEVLNGLGCEQYAV